MFVILYREHIPFSEFLYSLEKRKISFRMKIDKRL